MTLHSPLSPALNADRYTRFIRFVQNEIGVKLADSKRPMVEVRFRKRVAALGFANFDDYLRHLFEGRALQAERAEIFNAVTTNKTDFFREPAHFDHLAQEILPKLLPKKIGAAQVKIWSAAASTGAEVWTLAMVLAAQEQKLGAFRWAILGTDINTAVLETAARAIYPDSFLTPVPRPMQAQYLLRGEGEFAGQSRISADLRAHVRFAQHNLLSEESRIDRDIDVIFLRNVLIYFSPEDQLRVIERLARHLRIGGVLYLGHSESMMMKTPLLRTIAPSAYQRI